MILELSSLIIYFTKYATGKLLEPTNQTWIHFSVIQWLQKITNIGH